MLNRSFFQNLSLIYAAIAQQSTSETADNTLLLTQHVWFTDFIYGNNSSLIFSDIVPYYWQEAAKGRE
jgi:hypothetical protein